jgi:ribonuclease HI
VFSQNGKAIAEHSGGEANTTNNQMELTAVREAVRHAPPGIRLNIVTDSKNAMVGCRRTGSATTRLR